MKFYKHRIAAVTDVSALYRQHIFVSRLMNVIDKQGIGHELHHQNKLHKYWYNESTRISHISVP